MQYTLPLREFPVGYCLMALTQLLRKSWGDLIHTFWQGLYVGGGGSQ